MHLTIRARLTLLYFIVLAASFIAFFWICDIGFRRSIEITVNDASRSNLEIVRRVIEGSLPTGTSQSPEGTRRTRRTLGERRYF